MTLDRKNIARLVFMADEADNYHTRGFDSMEDQVIQELKECAVAVKEDLAAEYARSVADAILENPLNAIILEEATFQGPLDCYMGSEYGHDVYDGEWPLKGTDYEVHPGYQDDPWEQVMDEQAQMEYEEVEAAAIHGDEGLEHCEIIHDAGPALDEFLDDEEQELTGGFEPERAYIACSPGAFDNIREQALDDVHCTVNDSERTILIDNESGTQTVLYCDGKEEEVPTLGMHLTDEELEGIEAWMNGEVVSDVESVVGPLEDDEERDYLENKVLV